MYRRTDHRLSWTITWRAPSSSPQDESEGVWLDNNSEAQHVITIIGETWTLIWEDEVKSPELSTAAD